MRERWNLDRRIIIQDYTTTLDAMGEEVKQWATWKQCWAEKVPSIATYRKEKDLNQNQLVAESAVSWRVRNIGIVTTLMRVIDDTGKIYDVERVDEIGRRDGWLIKTRVKE